MAVSTSFFLAIALPISYFDSEGVKTTEARISNTPLL